MEVSKTLGILVPTKFLKGQGNVCLRHHRRSLNDSDPIINSQILENLPREIQNLSTHVHRNNFCSCCFRPFIPRQR